MSRRPRASPAPLRYSRGRLPGSTARSGRGKRGSRGWPAAAPNRSVLLLQDRLRVERASRPAASAACRPCTAIELNAFRQILDPDDGLGLLHTNRGERAQTIAVLEFPC